VRWAACRASICPAKPIRRVIGGLFRDTVEDVYVDLDRISLLGSRNVKADGGLMEAEKLLDISPLW
jgi:hypothetical protein